MAYVCAVPGINLADYSKDAQQRGWGSPCSGTMARVQLTVAAVSVDTRVAELVGLIMRANERDGYRYRAADTGAYNCRKISGTDVWSNHAWGAAVDCNWQSNPFTATLQTDRPSWEIDRWARYGWAWGGKYTGKKDAMHNEFMGTPAQAQAALVLARKELGSTTAATPTGGFLMALSDAQQNEVYNLLREVRGAMFGGMRAPSNNFNYLDNRVKPYIAYRNTDNGNIYLGAPGKWVPVTSEAAYNQYIAAGLVADANYLVNLSGADFDAVGAAYTA